MTGSMRHGAKKDHQGDSGRAGYGPRDGGGGARKKMDTSAEDAIVAVVDALVAAGDMAGLQALVDATVEGEMTAEDIRRKELAIQKLSVLYSKANKHTELATLVRSIRPLMAHFSKAKCGKLFRHLLTEFIKIDGVLDEQVALCLESIEWTKSEKRQFLRQTLEIMLASLHLKELKRLDDKLQLVEVQLMESKAYYALSNYPKSRGALVSARTTANGVYTPPRMQAGLDLQSGITHAQEQDFQTAYSYFYESFEGYDSTDASEEAVLGLKYMLLCKIMLEKAEDVPSILASKLALKYSTGDESVALNAMKAVAKANLNRSLEEFEKALRDFESELGADVTIQSHVAAMNDTMLQNNLCRIVEPYSSIEIEHVASLIKLPRARVEKKLSQMILDKKLTGILDQGNGVLEVHDVEVTDATYAAAIEVIQHTGQVVEALGVKAKKLI
eukprot:gene8082-19094_t